MHRLVSTLCIFIVIIATFTDSVSARPTTNLTRHKRQSDQRLAELETLLALQKYRHRLRPDRKGDSSRAGYGVVDFNLIGRRKKSTRFSPGEEHVEHVFSRSSSSWVSKDSEEQTPSDPVDNDKVDSLLTFPSLLIEKENPHQTIDILNQDKK